MAGEGRGVGGHRGRRLGLGGGRERLEGKMIYFTNNQILEIRSDDR